jgi:hypothetical protein
MDEVGGLGERCASRNREEQCCEKIFARHRLRSREPKEGVGRLSCGNATGE